MNTLTFDQQATLASWQRHTYRAERQGTVS